MVQESLRTLLATLEVLRPAFTRPGFQNLVVMFSGWVRTTGLRAVTEALVATSVAGRRHHEAFHRFFSRGTWSPDEVGRLVFGLIVKLFPGARRAFVIDDTLVHKRGAKVYGIASHIDPVHSTKRWRILAFGHVWVVFAVLVRVPFSHRVWALPLLFRLYRGKKECLGKRHPYRRKTDLAREMLDVVTQWTRSEEIQVSMDSAYCCDTVMRGLPPTIVVFGSLRGNAVLTGPTQLRRRDAVGRPRVRGKRLPNPRQLLDSARHIWRTCTATLYGRTTTVHHKEIVAQWYRGTGKRLLRIVVQRSEDGEMVRVFFTTDITMSAAQLLEAYSERWAIEVAFRELKQLLGFGDSSARKPAAVARTAPFAGLSYTLITLWMLQGTYSTPLAAPPLRPWYPHKRGLSFGDLLRAAQRILPSFDVLDLRRFDPIPTKIPTAKALRRQRPRTRPHSPLRQAA